MGFSHLSTSGIKDVCTTIGKLVIIVRSRPFGTCMVGTKTMVATFW
ncbi:hypothetical protein Leryth_007519 [Lithospermum erythrorhizon]|nr:hypothetical protein Leryth_007519 [Lithospermum erythrorhizon]